MAPEDRFDQDESSIEDFLRKRSEIDKTIREKFQRQVTVMFTDIVASTEFFETYGDLEGRSMVQRHNDLLRPLIEKHSGRILKGLGDGLMVAFDNPADAARAGVEIQKTLVAENKGKNTASRIWIKMAIHAGMGIVERDDVYGDVVNTSARICSLAGKGDILVSQAYIDAIMQESDIPHDYVGSKMLKGKSLPVDVHRILWDASQGADLKRSGEEGAQRSRSGEIALCVSVFREDERIKIGAHIEGRGAAASKYAHVFPYRESEIRILVEEIDQCMSGVDQRGRVTKANLLRLKDMCRSLYEMLIPDGFVEFMQNHPAGALILQIDDCFAHIPWELLHDGQQFLCLRYAMGKLVSGSKQVLGRKRDLGHRPLRMLVMTNPRGDLPATMKEGSLIRKELGRESASAGLSIDAHDRRATCEFLHAHMGDYDLFHFAGHSDHNPRDPSLSGLLLADGKFEIGRLLSTARESPLPSLVFANGCRSGRAENGPSGERLSGLANGFLVSGVRHYIGSTIDLFDRSSAVFAQEFYHHLVRSRSIGEALRLARLKAITHYGEETLTWASYVLYGDPTFQYFSRALPESEHEGLPAALKRYRVPAAAALAILLVLSALLAGYLWSNRSAGDSMVKETFKMIHSGRVAQAEEAFRSLEGKSPLYYQGMSAVYLSRGDGERAGEMLSLFGKDRPDSPFSQVMRAHLALHQGSIEEAEAGYRKALTLKEMEPWQRAECRFGLGRVLLKKNQLSQAVDEFDLALNLDPSFLQAYTAKGLALERMGRLENAVEHYEKAGIIDGDDPVNAALLRRSREQLAQMADAERRARVDALVNDLLKAHSEGSPAAGSRDEWTSRPLYVFFLELEARGQPAAREGEDAFFSEQIMRELGDSERFHLVERALMDRLLEELKLSGSRLADPQTALRLGKILSARLLTTGTMLRYKGQLQVTLRAVDTETTRVAASVSATCPSTEDPLKMLQTLTGNLKERIAGAYPVKGRVTEAADGEIVLNVGRFVGVTPGMKLKVVEKEGRGIILAVKDVQDQTCTALAQNEAGFIQTDWRVEED
jgi:class 3 adenylate cyclase/tetratricopeptide (TPR) repeat protein